MQIEVRNLTRDFGKTRAVDGISFEFATGQIFGFVGPNGAGKTTSLRILATLDEPTAGDVLIDGVSAVQYPERCRHRLGFMPDSLPEHRDMSVHEYLDFFARAYGLRSRRRAARLEQVEHFANLLGIRHKTLNALSKGMKQRVSLARALVHDPPLLLMDEPAAGLDPRARVELRELLRILAEQGKAVLISSHILTELAEICDGAVIVERGRLLRAGTLEALYRGGGTGEEASDRRVVAVRAQGGIEPLHRALSEMPGVRAVRAAGTHVEAEITGDEDDCCDLLAELLRRNFRVLEFKQVELGLEELFMTLTEGEVQ